LKEIGLHGDGDEGEMERNYENIERISL